MEPSESDRSGLPFLTAGTAGALVACCTVHVLVLAGVAGAIGGAAIGGLAAGAGIAVAFAIWLTFAIVRRRRRRRAVRSAAPKHDQATTTARRG